MSANNRASLLAGLRTGGVRSSTNPMPQTAAPTVTSFPHQDHPMSAAVGGSFNPYSAHAQVQAQAQAQAFQMQMMQMEIMRLQAIQQVQQAQQYQMEVARQQQSTNRRASQLMEPPQTAGPAATSFMTRRSSQAEHLKAQLHLNSNSKAILEEVPMTASLGGKFGGRLNPNATTFRMGGFAEEDETVMAPRAGSGAPANTPVTPSHTTVISGGTALGLGNGNGASNATSGTGVNNGNAPNSGMAPSKSDTSLNWRRGGANNSVLSGNRAASLNVRITPPPGERVSPPPGITKAHRPEPLRFSVIINEPTSAVAIDGSDGEAGDDDTSSSSSAKSEPTTPPSGESLPPLSPREVASKRLYEGLGIGRPAPQSAAVHTMSFPGSQGGAISVHAPYTSVGTTFSTSRIASQPVRQPRGPPSGVDELGPKNFATRIRRKAIGGLGAMLDARVNRREVEAY